jgi:hypothetical protein
MGRVLWPDAARDLLADLPVKERELILQKRTGSPNSRGRIRRAPKGVSATTAGSWPRIGSFTTGQTDLTFTSARSGLHESPDAT